MSYESAAATGYQAMGGDGEKERSARYDRPELTTSTGDTLVMNPSGYSGEPGAVSYSSGAAAPAGGGAGASVPQPSHPGPGMRPGPSSGIVTSQPAHRVFDLAHLDPGSQLNYSAVRGFHKSGQAALESIHGAGAQVLGMVDTTAAQLKDNITYEELLQTLIHENERILTKDWRLMYRQATFYDCQDSVGTIIDNLPSGAAILTNKRLLLLSAQMHKGMTLVNIGTDKKTRCYQVKATNSDNVHYKPLPLNNFASIEMSASAGASVTADVNPLFPCCWGCCTCFGCCCASARKRWTSLVSATDNHNIRVLKIGLLLPPWERKCMLHLDLEPQMPLSHARDFIAMLQQHPKLAA